jgi:hypothetical protein
VEKIKKEARTSVACVKSLLRNACTPLTSSNDSVLSSVAYQGAGLFNATTLLTSDTHVCLSAIESSMETYRNRRKITPQGIVTSAQITITNNLDMV